MNALTAQATPLPRERIVYPDSDGEPMAETEAHLLLMLSMIAMLRNYFRRQGKVYVIGNMFLYYQEGNPQAREAPDIMVVKGVDASAPRRAFEIWEEGAGPCVIFELTSDGTAGEDLGEKRRIYAEIGVREYFLYDPLNDYLPTQLMGWRLLNGKYEKIEPASDGSIISEDLGLRLVPAGRNLDLVRLDSGEKLLSPDETHELWQTLRNDLELAREEMDRVRRELDEVLREKEEADRRANEAQARVLQLEKEIRRLRGQS